MCSKGSEKPSHLGHILTVSPRRGCAVPAQEPGETGLGGSCAMVHLTLEGCLGGMQTVYVNFVLFTNISNQYLTCEKMPWLQTSALPTECALGMAVN